MKIVMKLAQGVQTAFVRTGRRFIADQEGQVEVEEFSNDHYDLLQQGATVFGLRRRGPGSPEVPSPPAPPVEPPVPPESDDGGTVTDPETPPGGTVPGPFDPVPPPADA